MIVPARRFAPRGSNYRQRGMGAFNPPQVPAYESCDPLDSACVARNNAKNSAYNLAMVQAQAQNNLDQCMENANNAMPGAQYDSAVASCHAAYGGGSGGGSSPSGGSGFVAPIGTPIDTPGGTVYVPRAAGPDGVPPAATTPAGAVIVNSSGAQSAAPVVNASSVSTALSLPTIAGFDLSTVPWWGWLGAGVAAWLAFGGKGGR